MVLNWSKTQRLSLPSTREKHSLAHLHEGPVLLPGFGLPFVSTVGSPFAKAILWTFRFHLQKVIRWIKKVKTIKFKLGNEIWKDNIFNSGLTRKSSRIMKINNWMYFFFSHALAMSIILQYMLFLQPKSVLDKEIQRNPDFWNPRFLKT